MIVYKKNNNALKHEVSTVSKVHTQVCRATLIAANTIEADDLMLFLDGQFKRGVTDHKRLVDIALSKISADGRVVKNNEPTSSQK